MFAVMARGCASPVRVAHPQSLTLFRLSTLLVWLIGGLAAAASEPDRALPAPIPAKLRELVDQQQISGGVVVVGRRNGIISYDAVGLRDIDAKLPMTKDTLFRIASMTKPVTAIGVMILVDEGKLSIEDPVERHLPEFRGQMLVAARNDDTLVLKKPARPITVRDLLTHTSGVPLKYPEGVGSLRKTRGLTLAEAVMAISQRPLEFEPGSKWEYCSPGIDTLGRIIEVASGLPYDRFVQQRIFAPLDMIDTTFFPNQQQRSRLAAVYQRRDGQLQAVPSGDSGPSTGSRYPSPAGGLYSTGADLARLYRMMLHGGQLDGKRILSEASVKAMTSLQTGDLVTRSPPGALGFGLGWFVVRRPEGWIEMFSPGAFGHGGALNTQAWIDPQQDLFSILLIHRPDLSDSQAEAIRGAVQALALAAVKGSPQ